MFNRLREIFAYQVGNAVRNKSIFTFDLSDLIVSSLDYEVSVPWGTRIDSIKLNFSSCLRLQSLDRISTSSDHDTHIFLADGEVFGCLKGSLVLVEVTTSTAAATTTTTTPLSTIVISVVVLEENFCLNIYKFYPSDLIKTLRG